MLAKDEIVAIAEGYMSLHDFNEIADSLTKKSGFKALASKHAKNRKPNAVYANAYTFEDLFYYHLLFTYKYNSNNAAIVKNLSPGISLSGLTRRKNIFDILSSSLSKPFFNNDVISLINNKLVGKIKVSDYAPGYYQYTFSNAYIYDRRLKSAPSVLVKADSFENALLYRTQVFPILKEIDMQYREILESTNFSNDTFYRTNVNLNVDDQRICYVGTLSTGPLTGYDPDEGFDFITKRIEYYANVIENSRNALKKFENIKVLYKAFSI